MARNKIIKGQYTSKGKIQIVDFDGVLLPDGQKVLVYKPTDKEIVGYLSGRKLGNKEKIINAGTIKMIDGKAYVLTDRKTNAYGRIRSVYPERLGIKRSIQPNVRGTQRNQKMRPAKVFIKLIDE